MRFIGGSDKPAGAVKAGMKLKESDLHVGCGEPPVRLHLGVATALSLGDEVPLALPASRL